MESIYHYNHRHPFSCHRGNFADSHDGNDVTREIVGKGGPLGLGKSWFLQLRMAKLVKK
jgi:hypothetical protein